MHKNGDMYIYNKENSNQYKEITMNELKYLIGKYEELDNIVEKLEKEVSAKIKY